MIPTLLLDAHRRQVMPVVDEFLSKPFDLAGEFNPVVAKALKAIRNPGLNIDVCAIDKFAQVAAEKVADEIRTLQLNSEKIVNMVLATSNTQIDFLDALANESGIEWHRVRVFHLDEYKGLSVDSEYSFAYYLHKHLLSKVNILPENIHYINGENPDLVGYIQMIKDC